MIFKFISLLIRPEPNHKVKAPSLSKPVHALFRRERWRVNDKEYKTLLPAMRLASNLIEVGMPYIANFLPGDDLLEDSQFSMEGVEVPVEKNPTHGKIKGAREALDEIADNVHWELDWNMYTVFGSWGMNFITNQEHPYKKEDPSMILGSDRDLARRGIGIRPVTIVLARHYFDTILKTEPDSEEHLRAVWHCGITMAHEIGHTILIHDTRWFSMDCSEPYVGNDAFSELGLAFIGWIFSGCNPETVKRGPNAFKFDAPLYWRKEKQTTDKKRELYRVHYSISTRYLQDLLTQSFWNSLGDGPGFFARAKAKIKPVLETGKPKPAIAIVPDFWVKEKGRPFKRKLINTDKRTDKVAIWKNEYRDRGDRGEEALESLSWAELDLAFENQKLTNMRVPDFESDEDEDDADTYDDEGYPVRQTRFVPPAGANPPAEDEKSEYHMRVEVAYTHREWSHTKRPREDDEDDEEEQAFKRPKRGHRVKVPYDSDESDPDDDDKTLEDELLDISVPFIENSYTRRQANEFCKEFGLRPFAGVPRFTAWQEGQLNRQDDDDRGIISQIRVFLLNRLIEKHKSDKKSELKIRQVIADSTRDWDLEDLFDYCQNNGLNYDEDEDVYEDVIERISDHMDNEMHLIKGYPGKDKSPSPSIDSDAELDEPLKGDWDEFQFKDFFLEHDLPTWGNLRVFRERYYGYRFEQKHDYPRPRDTSYILAVTNPGGVELYSWLVNIYTRNVQDLKNALFCMATLPSNSVLHLAIERPYDDNNLPDTKLLYEIPKVHERARFLLAVSEYKPPTRPEVELLRPEPKIIWNSKDRNYRTMRNLRAAAQKARAAVTPLRAPPRRTIAQRMVEIADQDRALKGLLEPVRPNQPISGTQLLNDLEALEERNAVMGIRVNPEVVKILEDDEAEAMEKDDGDGLGRGFGVGKSHMGDLYRGLGRLNKPAREGIKVKLVPETAEQFKVDVRERQRAEDEVKKKKEQVIVIKPVLKPQIMPEVKEVRFKELEGDREPVFKETTPDLSSEAGVIGKVSVTQEGHSVEI